MRAVATLRPVGRVRTQWTALAAALVVLAGVVVTWAVSSAGRRVQVVQVAQQVEAGTPIEVADLITAAVAFDPGVEGLVPAASLDALLGRIAAIDLEPGVLLQRGMWRDGETLLDGERAVGAVLSAGRYPPGLAPGDLVVGAPLGGLLVAGLDGSASSTIDGGAAGSGSATSSTSSTGSAAGSAAGLAAGSTASAAGGSSNGTADGQPADESGGVLMRVLDATLLDNGSLTLSLAVDAAQAVAVAQLAATDQLVVVRLPVAPESTIGGEP
ncbi:MAG: hypothetical protein ACKOYG_07120 [Ilumatobacteraceae bacterium]